MKKAAHVIGGLCCFLCSIGQALLVLRYVSNGAGLQFFPLGISPVGILMGLAHVVGLTAGSVICFAFGAHFCSQGIDRSAD